MILKTQSLPTERKSADYLSSFPGGRKRTISVAICAGIPTMSPLAGRGHKPLHLVVLQLCERGDEVALHRTLERIRSWPGGDSGRTRKAKGNKSPASSAGRPKAAGRHPW